MTARSLPALELCWKAMSFQLPLQSHHATPLHIRRLKKDQFLHNYLETNFQVQHHYYSSYVVKSPFKDIEIPNRLIPEIVWEMVDRFPDVTALKCGLTGRSFTFAELQKLSYRFSCSLKRAGFTRGDVLALVLPNCPEFAVITLGALEAQMVVSFINHVYTADEMCHQLKDSGSVCIVTATEKLDVVLSAITKVESLTQSKPFRRIVTVDISASESLPRGVSRFSEMVAKDVSHFEKITSSDPTQPSDLAFLPYSSGTTGLSKGVCLSHKNIVCNIHQMSSIEEVKLNSPEEGQDISLGLLPFYHIYGLTVVLLYSLANGAQVITLPKFEQDSFIRTMENEKLSIMSLVPPLILFLGSYSKVESKHLANVRLIFSGAAPLGASDMEKVKTKIPSENNCMISQAYGMTELSPVATMPKLPCKNLATVGAPLPNTFGKIINSDTGDVLGPNQCGELCFKGPQVMLGYHNNLKATSDMIDADGWLRTGDIGYYDEDSHFYVQDRLKELIKVKGFQVPPAELEEVLRTHPLVSDVGVIGVPCSRAGEMPVAYVVVQKNKILAAEDIKEFLSKRVSRHKQVGEVIFIDTIPKSAAGKILRKDLRRLFNNSNKQL